MNQLARLQRWMEKHPDRFFSLSKNPNLGQFTIVMVSEDKDKPVWNFGTRIFSHIESFLQAALNKWHWNYNQDDGELPEVTL